MDKNDSYRKWILTFLYNMTVISSNSIMYDIFNFLKLKFNLKNSQRYLFLKKQ